MRYTYIVRDAIVSAILQANTLATKNVTANRSWPTQTTDLPAVLVATPIERKESMGRIAPSFTTVAAVTVVARTLASDPIVVEQDNATLVDQIYQAVLTSDPVMSIIQQMRSIHTEIAVTADQRNFIAEASIVFEAEFPEFYQAAGYPLAEVDIDFATTDTGELLAAAKAVFPSPIEVSQC